MFQMQIEPNTTNLPVSYLGYSLLIILAVAAALVKIYLLWRRGRFTQGYRMVIGLSALLIARLATFLLTYLGWQAQQQFSPDLLALDQTSALIGIILISWMWNFPEQSREIDLLTILITLGAAALIGLQLTAFPALLEGPLGAMAFWQGFSITFLVISTGLILIRKPNLWHHGLFMMGILLIGSILTLLGGNLDILHLSQLAAYPLLLVLGDRFPIGVSRPSDQPEEQQLGRRHFSVEYNILAIIEQLFNAKDRSGILYKIAKTTAYLILSDLTLVIDTPDQHGKIRVIAGYDLIREEPLQAVTLDSKSIPLISNYIERGKMLHIPASSTSRDLSHLAKMLQLTNPGHLLASPVHVAGANKTIGVILFSPFSNRPWTKEDQDYIQLLCKLYEQAFDHHLATEVENDEGVHSTIQDLSSKLTALSKDKLKLREDIALLSKEHQNLLLDQSSLQKKYNRLLSWGNALQRHLEMLVNLSEKESTEALRKYIAVIEKELSQVREEGDYKEPAELSTATEKIIQTTEADPDSSRPANLVEAIDSCLQDIQSEIDKKQLTTIVDLPDDPPLLKMNHALFREIFSFLISNAVTETDSAGELQIRTQIYKEDHSQHFAHIKVTDQGEGYYPDEIAGILNDHLTAEQQDQLSQVMTNLYVTKNLVENEGGRMWVESSPGTGTTVSLLLAFL
jgi:signal transduction histidine kinase